MKLSVKPKGRAGFPFRIVIFHNKIIVFMVNWIIFEKFAIKKC